MPAAAIAAAFLAAASAVAPVAAQGSQNEMFRRHFWRGQAYHGEGYAAQVHEIGKGPQRSGNGASSMEALVEAGSPGAAIARSAARCAAGAKTYSGRGGRLYRCP